MIPRKLYYEFKPYLPWAFRMALRRSFASRLRKKHAGTWPIHPSSTVPPAWWRGWPDQKEFALVLTHDVEGREGLAQVRAVAELEMRYGLRSSFNFVPEGEYQVPERLRGWLTDNGFEVGVHDLNHDGKLYASRFAFREKAKRINHYLKEWGAAGYRSGYMLHNLAWHHDLDVAYDASTFDTDPFEPQPDGACTIFPFWVQAPEHPERQGGIGPAARAGYVELPYTLPQDSTLFLVLGERTNAIWKDKLAWLTQHRGLALLNTHPDYFDFNGNTSRRKYAANLYSDFLEHILTQYSNLYWHALPRQVAAHVGASRAEVSMRPQHEFPSASDRPGASLTGKRAAVLLYSYYPADPRPRRAAEAMAEAGMEVEVICLNQGPDEPRKAKIRGVTVRRLGVTKRRGGKLQYLLQYSHFIVACSGLLSWRSLRKRYDFVHVHNMPDVLVFAAAVPKFLGARVALDLHDPMPELMTTIFALPGRHWLVRTLRAMERWSIAFADVVFTPNVTFKNLFASRSHHDDKIRIIMNSPEQEIFDPTRYQCGRAPRTEGFRIMHHGSLVHRHGVDLLVEAVAKLKPVIPGLSLQLYGARTEYLDTVLRRAQELGIPDAVQYHGAKNQREIAQAIVDCDLGVIPNRRSVFTELNFPTRIFEYLSMGRAVVAPDTLGIRDYFGRDNLPLFVPDDVNDLCRVIRAIYDRPDETQELVARGQGIYRQHLWSRQKDRLLASLAH